MMRIRKHVYSLLFLVLPLIATGQTMTVIGGNNMAQECLMNANIASDLEFVGDLAKPCDYALDNVSLSVHDRAATHANRGIIRTNNDRFNAALKDFEKAASISPDSGEIYVNRGNVYFHERDFEQAIADYSKALDLNINQKHVAHLDRGMAYERIGDTMMAEEDYRQALEYMPQWTLAKEILDKFLVKQEAKSKPQ